jgi:imidazolonepropionase-like amidohydrolase
MADQGTFANIASNPPRPLVELGRAAVAALRDSPAAEATLQPAVERSHQPETAGIRPALARWQFARRMIQLGVPVCFSTDSIYGTWDDGHDLSYLAQALVEAGDFAPLDVIRMITAIPARAIGLAHQIGTLEAGKLADLLVVTGDLTTNIRSLHAVQAVYRSGTPSSAATQILSQPM